RNVGAKGKEKMRGDGLGICHAPVQWRATDPVSHVGDTSMKRVCTHCQRPFTPNDLSRDESRGMQAERKARGVEGVRLVYYRCPCGTNDIFVDILPRKDESTEDFDRRRAEMEIVVRKMHGGHAKAVVNPVAGR